MAWVLGESSERPGRGWEGGGGCERPSSPGRLLRARRAAPDRQQRSLASQPGRCLSSPLVSCTLLFLSFLGCWGWERAADAGRRPSGGGESAVWIGPGSLRPCGLRSVPVESRVASCTSVSAIPLVCFPSAGPGSPSVDSSSVVTVPRPSTPSRLALFLRQQSLGGSEAPAPAPRSPGLAASPASSPGRRPSPAEEPGELEDNYLEYLREARRGVDRCVQACRAWSAPYDGERPPPEPSPLGSRTKKRSLLAEEDGDNAGEGEEEELGGGGLAGGAREGPGHLPPPQLNGVPGPWPEGAKKVRRVPQEGAGELPEGTPEAVAGLEGFGQELRELEVALSNGGAGSEPSLEPSLPLEEEEAYESFACPPEPPGPFLSSPLRTLNQLPSQPFTGKPRSPGLLLWALFACSRRVCAGLQTSWPRHACVLAPLLIRLLGSPPDTRHVPLVSPCLSVHLPCLCWFVVTEGQALRVCPMLCPVRMILLPGLAASWDV